MWIAVNFNFSTRNSSIFAFDIVGLKRSSLYDHFNAIRDSSAVNIHVEIRWSINLCFNYVYSPLWKSIYRLLILLFYSIIFNHIFNWNDISINKYIFWLVYWISKYKPIREQEFEWWIVAARPSPAILLDLPPASRPLQSKRKRGLDPPPPRVLQQAGGRPPHNADRRLYKRSSYRSVDQIFNSNSNFEFLSTWNVSDLEDVATATEMSDDMMRSLGFPVPSTSSPAVQREKPILPIVDNHFMHFVSRK